MSWLPLHSYRTFLLDTEFWVGPFFQHLTGRGQPSCRWAVVRVLPLHWASSDPTTLGSRGAPLYCCWVEIQAPQWAGIIATQWTCKSQLPTWSSLTLTWPGGLGASLQSREGKSWGPPLLLSYCKWGATTVFCFRFVHLWCLVGEEQLLSKFSVLLDSPFPNPLSRGKQAFIITYFVWAFEVRVAGFFSSRPGISEVKNKI